MKIDIVIVPHPYLVPIIAVAVKQTMKGCRILPVSKLLWSKLGGVLVRIYHSSDCNPIIPASRLFYR